MVISKNIFLIWLKEFFYRLIYVFISFLLCSLVIFFNIENLLLFETYPFLRFSNKKFIVTHITELFDAIWVLTLSTAFNIVAPFFFYQLMLFSKSSWYIYQIKLFLRVLRISFFSYFYFSIVCHCIILPYILDFLTQWRMENVNLILYIEVEFRILNYIYWILSFRYFFSLLSYYFSIIIIYNIFFHVFIQLYKFIKFYRNQITFLNILTIFFFIPPDIFIQFCAISAILFLYESLFFFICYKLKNYNNFIKCQLYINY